MWHLLCPLAMGLRKIRIPEKPHRSTNPWGQTAGTTLFPSRTNFWPKCSKPQTEIPTWRAASGIGCDKRGRQPFYHFRPADIAVRFEIGKIVKNAALNSDQLDLILGKNLARLLREPKPATRTTMDIT